MQAFLDQSVRIAESASCMATHPLEIEWMKLGFGEHYFYSAC
jgi:hypothetical protein